MREQKQFELRAARKAETRNGLHNTVLVYRAHNAPVEYAHIQFSDALTVAVGRIMPQGISDFSPAFMQVHFDNKQQQWVISASYVMKNVRRVLWSSDDFPHWLKTLRKIGENNNGTSRTPPHQNYALA